MLEQGLLPLVRVRHAHGCRPRAYQRAGNFALNNPSRCALDTEAHQHPGGEPAVNGNAFGVLRLIVGVAIFLHQFSDAVKRFFPTDLLPLI